MSIIDGQFFYELPYDIKEKFITKNFLSSLFSNLRIICNIGLEQTFEDSWEHLGNTSGFDVAFFKTCKDNNILEFYDYSKSLEWYERDIFVFKLIDLLVEENFIIKQNVKEVVAEKLNVNPNELAVCLKCKKIYKKIEMCSYEDQNEETSYVCNHCDGKDSELYKGNVSEPYLDILKEVNKYDKGKDNKKKHNVLITLIRFGGIIIFLIITLLLAYYLMPKPVPIMPGPDIMSGPML